MSSHLKVVANNVTTKEPTHCETGYRDLEVSLLLKKRDGQTQQLNATLDIALQANNTAASDALHHFVKADIPEEQELSMEQFLSFPHVLENQCHADSSHTALRFLYPAQCNNIQESYDVGFQINRALGHSTTTVELDIPLTIPSTINSDDNLNTAIDSCNIYLAVELKSFMWLEDLLDIVDETINKLLVDRLSQSGQPDGICPLITGSLLKQLATRLANHRRIANYQLEASELDPETHVTRYSKFSS